MSDKKERKHYVLFVTVEENIADSLTSGSTAWVEEIKDKVRRATRGIVTEKLTGDIGVEIRLTIPERLSAVQSIPIDNQLLPAVKEALVGTAFEDAEQVVQAVTMLDFGDENTQRLEVQFYEVRDPYYDKKANTDRSSKEVW